MGWWARQDSNLRPRDYESPALTAELRARDKLNVCCKYMYDTSRDRTSNADASLSGCGTRSPVLITWTRFPETSSLHLEWITRQLCVDDSLFVPTNLWTCSPPRWCVQHPSVRCMYHRCMVPEWSSCQYKLTHMVPMNRMPESSDLVGCWKELAWWLLLATVLVPQLDNPINPVRTISVIIFVFMCLL